MLSMVAGYGPRSGLRKVAITWVCSLFILASYLSVPAEAKTVRLLVLGDSLGAGYGLAQPDGFQAQLVGFFHQFLDPRDRVMVGQRDHVQPGRPRQVVA